MFQRLFIESGSKKVESCFRDTTLDGGGPVHGCHYRPRALDESARSACQRAASRLSIFSIKYLRPSTLACPPSPLIRLCRAYCGTVPSTGSIPPDWSP